MSPSNLQGLNLIQPDTPPSNLSDAQDLLSGPLFPDLAAHLDLWTNVNFASDEPFISARDKALKGSPTQIDTSHAQSLTQKENHFAVPTTSPVSAPALPQQPQFDFSRFLAEFGLSAGSSAADSLTLQNPPALTGLPRPDFAAPVSNSFSAPTTVAPAPRPESTPAPPAKRARTSPKSQPAVSTPASPATFPDPEPDTSTPLTASEDKRRRNTAASARFRLKKKEREAALDSRAQALEDRVTSLERECEGLRRENGWLRGLVVGVTGGVVPTMDTAPIGVLPSATAGGDKRKRDDDSA